MIKPNKITKLNANTVGVHDCARKTQNNTNKHIANIVGAGLVSARDHRGITLVALIITIIIMLILLGVTVNIALNGGLFGMTKEAVKQTEIAAYKEKIDAVRINIIVEQISKGLTSEEFMARYEEELRKDKNFEGSEITREGETITITTKEGYKFIITEEGTNYEGDTDAPETPENPPDLNESNTEIKYDTKEWTKGPVKLTIETRITGYTIEYSINGGTWKEYQYPEEIEVKDNNTIIDARLKKGMEQVGGALTGTVSNIDRLAPTVTLSQNGGTYVLPTTNGEVEGSATISTQITAVDHVATPTDGESKIKIAQYAWSTSNTVEPTEGWTDFTNEEPISKEDISTAGTWYLWTKVIDNAGNHAGNQEGEAQVSNAFVVGGANEEANQIKLTPDDSNWTNGWTNKDVEVTVSYGTNLTENRILTCEGTLGEDYTIEGTEGTDYTINGTTVTVKTNEIKVTVKMNGKMITAKAKDEAGNEVVATQNINNIDRVAPTITVDNLSLDPATSTYKVVSGSTIKFTLNDDRKDDDGLGCLFLLYWVPPKGNQWAGHVDEFGSRAGSDGSRQIEFFVSTIGTYKFWTEDKAGSNPNKSEVVTVEVLPITAEAVKNNAKDYYGALVDNYKPVGLKEDYKWRIFHSDGDNIYLIADDYIRYDDIPTTRSGYALTKESDYTSYWTMNALNDYSEGSKWIKDNSAAQSWLEEYLDRSPNNTNRNMKATAFMMDTNKWSKFTTNYADWAIGGPTAKMFDDSWKNAHGLEYKLDRGISTEGYHFYWVDGDSTATTLSGLPRSNDFNGIYVSSSTRAPGYRLASPHYNNTSNLVVVRNDGTMLSAQPGASGQDPQGFRPVVQLKDTVWMTYKSSGEYSLSM